MATENDSALPISVAIARKGLVYRVQRERYATEHTTPVFDPLHHFLEEVAKTRDNRLAAFYTIRNTGTGRYILERLESTLYPYIAEGEGPRALISIVSGTLAEPVIVFIAEVEETRAFLDLISGSLVVVVLEHTLFDIDEADAFLDLVSGAFTDVVIEHTMFDVDEADALLDLDSGTLVAVVIEHTLFDIDEADIFLDLVSGSLVTV